MKIRTSKTSRDYSLEEITEACPDRGKLLYSDGFPVRGRVEIFDPERIKRVRRRIEEKIRKDIGFLFDVLHSQGLMYDQFLK